MFNSFKVVFLHHPGDMSEKFQAHFSGDQFDPERWSARIFSDDVTLQSVTIHICSPVLSSVGLYHLQLHIMTSSSRISYLVGSFVLLCNPWLKGGPMYSVLPVLLPVSASSFCYYVAIEVLPQHCRCFSGDPVYMPLDAQIREYITSDYGMLFMGSHSNVSRRPWSFGQVCDTQLLSIKCDKKAKLRRQEVILNSGQLHLCFHVCSMSLGSWKHVCSSYRSAHSTSVTRTETTSDEQTLSTSAGWSVPWWETTIANTECTLCDIDMLKHARALPLMPELSSLLSSWLKCIEQFSLRLMKEGKVSKVSPPVSGKL